MSPPRPASRRLAWFAAAACAAVATAVAAHRDPAPPGNGGVSWTEAEWRQPLDNWGQGRAWRAAAADGGEITLHARTKTGFCNCFGGIADDVEIDRIGDVDLHGDDFAPVSPGVPMSVGDLAGRARLFRASGKGSGARYVLSVVVASDCRAVVATIVSRAPVTPETEAAALALLRGDAFRRWAANQ